MIRASRRWARPALMLVALALVSAPAGAGRIRGTVFEDVNYGGGAGRPLTSGVALDGARVELYDAAGNFLASTVTAAAGGYNYQFLGTANAVHIVRVVNSTVRSSRLGWVAALRPVQTFRTDGSTSAAVPVTDSVGGQNPAVVDAGAGALGAVLNPATGVFSAPAALAGQTAQSISTVNVTGNLDGIDFGFNFSTIVNANASGQGSLRQFILNSNALAHAGLAIVGQPANRDVSIFMISDGLAHPGLRAGLANLLTGGVAVVALGAADLSAITAADTSVDGTTQTANVGNTNPAVLGTGGTVGVDGLALGTVGGPEVEIRGSSGANNCGLQIQGANAIVRGLAIRGFGNVQGEGGVCVQGVPNALIEGNVLGSSAASFADPGVTALRNESGVYGANSAGSTVRGNLIGFGHTVGIYLAAGATGWTVSGNEIRDNGMDTADGDGITVNAATGTAVTGNLLVGSSSQGLVVTAGATGTVSTNNTITGNGVGIPTALVQSAGVVMRSTAASTLLDRNVIRSNYGAGVQANNGSNGTRMTRNSFALNGTITARNGAGPTGQIGIDLNAPFDNVDFGTSPFYSLNDAGDVDIGGNGRLNFPVLVSASLSGGNLTLLGFARPGSVIELFSAAPDPSGFGEGMTWGITLTEGGTGAGGDDPYPDANAATGTYGPAPVNGLAQGTDTTNWFVFTFPAPAGVVVGTQLTATATLGGETSEFSGNVTVASTTAVKLMWFEANPSDRAVELSWRTGSELDNLGFHLYRAPSEAGPWERITSSLIPGLGSSPIGAAYTWEDAGLENGVRYFYRLEDVDSASVSTFHGPVSAVPQADSTGADDEGSGEGAALATCTSPPSFLPCVERYGEPSRVSSQILSWSPRYAVVELETGGFEAVRDADGRVRVRIPGFEDPEDPHAPALPFERMVLEAPVGRGARVTRVEERDVQSFPGLDLSAVGYREMEVRADGTVRAVRRGASLREIRGRYFPKGRARLGDVQFVGESKERELELYPVRYDAVRGAVRLSRRLRVRVDFVGQEPGEKGKGARGRRDPRRSVASGESLAFLHTTTRGLYGVGFESVFPGQRRGLSVDGISLKRDGEAVSFHVEPATGTFGPGSVLYFYADAAPTSTAYTGEVSWELSRESGGTSMAQASASPVGSPLTTASVGRAEFETNRIYQSGLLEAEDLWLWENLQGGVWKSKSFVLGGVDPTSSRPARLSVWLQGASDAEGVVDHHVEVSVNGTFVGEGVFDGKASWRFEVEMPSSLLREGSNELTVRNAGDTGVYSLVFLDRFAVEYPQRSELRAGLFEGRWAAEGVAEAATTTAVVGAVDVTDPTHPVWLQDLGSGAGVVSLRAEAGREYVLASAEGVRRPRVSMPVATGLKDASSQADYILITPQAFVEAAGPLVARRQSQGLRTRVATLEEIASAFGHGEASAKAIQAFLTYAYQEWQRPSPRYVLLLGDASHDPRNFIGTSGPAPLPALFVKTSYLVTASDPVLAAVNGEDPLPDLAIGRLPAQTVEQAQALVEKILSWEDSGQGLAGKAVLVADNPDGAGDFEANVLDIKDRYLGGRPTQTIFLRQEGSGTRAKILEALNSGASLVSYVGHGGAAVWASENVLNSWDAASLQAQSEQAVMLTLNCLNGYFVTPTFESLGEAFLKVEGRGTVATVSPTGLSLDGPAHVLHRALMEQLTSGSHDRLGDAVLAAQEEYARSGQMPELLEIYHLLGDPGMMIR